MIVVIVTFPVSAELDTRVLKEKFLETAPLYQDAKGLIRKNYLADMEKNCSGGVYFFDTVENAKTWFDDERIEWISNRYSKPNIQFFDSPVTVDNIAGEIIS